ncbi:msr8655 [Mesorhizobium japonicum MAFF 303099]|uniref:Msr8655 protein n=1 Tax=Mesorhizobium japonicum (strain LMG 29417 / CECT 9101 / MAFF 303099) TaxID=266835 RepID=Q98DT1_RHILO|nr:msr8655 [Mesorhizobium japonicum MAFF 303099]
MPFGTPDAPWRLDFSREAEIAAVSNSCVGNEIRQPPELESITLPRPDYRRCRRYAI